jgi:hypothetical protein
MTIYTIISYIHVIMSKMINIIFNHFKSSFNDLLLLYLKPIIKNASALKMSNTALIYLMRKSFHINSNGLLLFVIKII